MYEVKTKELITRIGGKYMAEIENQSNEVQEQKEEKPVFCTKKTIVLACIAAVLLIATCVVRFVL